MQDCILSNPTLAEYATRWTRLLALVAETRRAAQDFGEIPSHHLYPLLEGRYGEGADREYANHIGLACESLDATLAHIEDSLGTQAPQDIEEQADRLSVLVAEKDAATA